MLKLPAKICISVENRSGTFSGQEIVVHLYFAFRIKVRSVCRNVTTDDRTVGRHDDAVSLVRQEERQILCPVSVRNVSGGFSDIPWVSSAPMAYMASFFCQSG
jgi:hypothetical protein